MKRAIAVVLMLLAPVLVLADKEHGDMKMDCDQKCMEKCMQMKDHGMKDSEMDMKCMDMMDGDMHKHTGNQDAKAKAHHGVGTVKSVDPSKDSITVMHEPVESMGWPVMTMAFNVKDSALLQKVSPGKKVKFDFVQEGSQYVITAIN